MKATQLVHWPGKDTAACDEHLQKLVGLAAVLGFSLNWTPIIGEAECGNCINEHKRAHGGQEGKKP